MDVLSLCVTASALALSSDVRFFKRLWLNEWRVVKREGGEKKTVEENAYLIYCLKKINKYAKQKQSQMDILLT